MEGYFIFTGGLIVGGLVVTIFRLARTATGKLLIDSSNPEKDVFRVNLDNLDDMYKKSFIELKIVRDADLSHE